MEKQTIDIRSISEKWVGIWQRGENPNLFQCVDEAIKEALKPSIQEEGLNKVYEQYIELLILELHETVPLAARLGWESTKFAKGEKLRHKINQLKLKS